MKSFFDVFKWDRFVAPSAMELLFWLLAAIAALFGAWGIASGLSLLDTNPFGGLILMAVSVVGAVAGTIAARVACEAVVILFRVNENLMDIAERTLAPSAAPPLGDADAARLDRRIAEARERAAGRAEAKPERPAIDHRPIPREPPPEPETPERDPFAPVEGRVEPKAWDVQPVEAKPVAEIEPVIEVEPVDPPVHPRETRGTDGRDAVDAPRRPSPTITLGEKAEPKSPMRDASPPREPKTRERGRSTVGQGSGQGSGQVSIEHALRRLAEPAGTEALRAGLAAGEVRLPDARPEDVDFLSAAPPEQPPVHPPAAEAPAPAPEEDVTSLPAFIGVHPPLEEELAAPAEAAPRNARAAQPRKRNGEARPAAKAAPAAANDALVPPHDAPPPARSRNGAGKAPVDDGHAKGGEAPLKRRKPRRPTVDGA